MKIKAEKSKRLPEGKHSGIIKDISYRHEPYEYVDIWIELKEGGDFDGIIIKADFPAFISVDSGLGQLMQTVLDLKIIEGKDYEPEQLKGKEVSFLTQDQETEKGVFQKVIKSSIKRK